MFWIQQRKKFMPEAAEEGLTPNIFLYIFEHHRQDPKWLNYVTIASKNISVMTAFDFGDNDINNKNWEDDTGNHDGDKMMEVRIKFDKSNEDLEEVRDDGFDDDSEQHKQWCSSSPPLMDFGWHNYLLYLDYVVNLGYFPLKTQVSNIAYLCYKSGSFFGKNLG